MLGFLWWAFLEGLCNVLIQIISPATLWLRFKTGLARERRAWGLGYQLRERARREERGEDWRCIWTTIGIPDDGCEPLDKREATRVNITPGREYGQNATQTRPSRNQGYQNISKNSSQIPRHFFYYILLHRIIPSVTEWMGSINRLKYQTGPQAKPENPQNEPASLDLRTTQEECSTKELSLDLIKLLNWPPTLDFSN